MINFKMKDNRLELIADDFELLLRKYNLKCMYIIEDGKAKDWVISINQEHNVLLIGSNDCCPCCHPENQSQGC